jgi:hypothetical protein
MRAEKDTSKVSLESHGIETYRDWSLTTYGGRQFDMLGAMDNKNVCSSVYLGSVNEEKVNYGRKDI